MKLRKVIVENFRCYKGKHEIEIDDITTFIGKNDAGKSTILDALDIYFNNIKPEKEDLCVGCEEESYIIGCVFESFPEQIILDDSVITNFKDEYLLNKNQLLEIHKKYPCNSTLTTRTIKSYIVAEHPQGEFSNLHTKTQKQLQELCKQKQVDEDIDLTKNSEMRKKLWSTLSEEERKTSETHIEKYIPQIEPFLPIYSLFKVDRSNTDQDSDIQDPFKIAIKEALKESQTDLDKISDEVRKKLNAITEETINKLEDIQPDLAKNLKLEIPTPKWENIFKISLKDDRDININKRGSGTRRLLLLSFFRAKAEMQKKEKNAPLIIAVEEPETSLHPNMQREVVDTFQKLIDEQEIQVILTTHTPEIAGRVPLKSLRLISSNNQEAKISSGKTNEKIYDEICNALGVHAKLMNDRLKLIILLEGDHDVIFVRNISHALHIKDNNIIDLSNQYDHRFAFLPLNGNSLKFHVEVSNYFTNLIHLTNIKSYGFFDRETEGENDHREQIENLRAKGHDVHILKKRAIENYIHPEVIAKYFNIEFEAYNDDEEIPIKLSKCLKEQGKQPRNKKNCKKHLCLEVSKHMTIEKLKEIDSENEILTFLSTIKDLIRE